MALAASSPFTGAVKRAREDRALQIRSTGPSGPAFIASVLLAVALIAAMSAWAGARLGSGPDGAPQAVIAASQSVVTLYAERPAAGLTPFNPGDGPPPESQTRWRWRTASGFAFAEGGWIVTNHHAVAGARRIEARLANGLRVEADIHALDPRRDLAVVRLTHDAAPRALRPSSGVTLGDAVYALGAPFDLAGTLTAGVVAGFDRPYDGVDPIGYLQHDAALNPGNSGGPLLDRHGRVAGLNTAIAEPAIMNVGVSFAIPADIVFAVAERLRQTGTAEPARLGLAVRSLDQALAGALALSPGEGLIVDAVEEGSPAQQAGLEAGDVLLTIDGAALGLPRDLNRALLDRAPGDVAALVWRRGRTRLETTVTLASPASAAGLESRHGDGVEADGYGLNFGPATPEAEGARVARVQPGSPASRAGFRAGDRILAVNGRAVADGLEARLRLQEAGEAAALRVLHVGERTPRHVGLARAASQALSAPGQTWPDAAGGPY